MGCERLHIMPVHFCARVELSMHTCFSTVTMHVVSASMGLMLDGIPPRIWSLASTVQVEWAGNDYIRVFDASEESTMAHRSRLSNYCIISLRMIPNKVYNYWIRPCGHECHIFLRHKNKQKGSTARTYQLGLVEHPSWHIVGREAVESSIEHGL